MNLRKAKKLPCAELARAAEREFTAFFSAVREILGAEGASVAGEEWLEAFQTVQLPIASSGEMCREVTVVAAAGLARRVMHSRSFFIPPTSAEPTTGRYLRPIVSSSAPPL